LTPLEKLLDALEHGGFKPQPRGSEYCARCPAHDDHDPSLSLREADDGRVLVHCHAGCSSESIVGALGFSLRDLFVVQPRSPNESTRTSKGFTANLDTFCAERKLDRRQLIETWRVREQMFDGRPAIVFPTATGIDRVRFLDGNEPKTKWAERGGKAHWYGLPEGSTLATGTGDAVLYIVNGEPSVWACSQSRVAAVCTCAGERADITNERLNELRQSTFSVIRVVYDHDETGRAGALKLTRSLRQAGLDANALELPANLGEGGDVDDLHRMVGDEQLAERLAELPELPEVEGTEDNGPPKPGDAVVSLRVLYSRPELLRPPTAIVPGLAYRGRLVMLAGPEKSGKSTMLGWAAAAVSSGGEFAAHRLDRGRVLWVGLEEPLADAVQRFRSAEADPDLVDLLFYLPHGHEELFAAIRELSPIWVVIDSLIRWGESASPPIADWAPSAQAASLVNKLADLCHRTDLGLTMTHHTRRADGKFRDSSAIGAAVDLIDEMAVDGGKSANPNVRHIRPIGRFTVDPFSLVKTPKGFFPAEGDGGSLRDRILAHIRHNPGCSRKSVRGGVEGRAESIKLEIDRLLEDRWIEDHATAVGSRLYLLSDAVALAFETGREQVGTGLGTGQIVTLPKSESPDGDKAGQVGTGLGNRSESGCTATPLRGGSREQASRTQAGKWGATTSEPRGPGSHDDTEEFGP
jgi:hypothetical protein